MAPGIVLEPTPGHTPGHVSVHLTSNGQEALITGDCIHHPCQLTKPEWYSSADNDQDFARETRKALLARYCGTDAIFIGSHFAPPSGGLVRALEEEGRYWLDTGSN